MSCRSIRPWQLRACGAVLAGKTNMHELGAGTSGINPHHGSTRNPYHTGRVSGGSSSGSAAAVCAGLCPVALGADGGGACALSSTSLSSFSDLPATIAESCRAVPLLFAPLFAGSVRMPAALCGVVGFKPTAGRLSNSGCGA